MLFIIIFFIFLIIIFVFIYYFFFIKKKEDISEFIDDEIFSNFDNITFTEFTDIKETDDILNIDNAKLYVPIVASEPQYYTSKQMTLNNFSTNTTKLYHLVNFFFNGFFYVYNKEILTSKTLTSDSKIFINNLENFISDYITLIKNSTKNYTTIKNLPFSCDLTNEFDYYLIVTLIPSLLGYYLLVPQTFYINTNINSVISNFIINTIIDPSNTIFEKNITDDYIRFHLAAPWLLSKNFIQKLDYSIYKCVGFSNLYENSYLFKEDTNNGIVFDNSYVENGITNISKFLNSCNYFTVIFFALENITKGSILTSFFDLISTICHPSISATTPSVSINFGKPNFKTITYKYSSNGIKILPFYGYMRYFSNDYEFSIKTITCNINNYKLLDYENDDMVKNFTYYINYRNLHTVDTKTDFVFPNILLSKINENSYILQTNEYVYKNSVLKRPNEVCKIYSMVSNYNKYGFSKQRYVIYTYIVFDEEILIDTSQEMITIYLTIYNMANNIKLTSIYDTDLQEQSLHKCTNFVITFDLVDGTKSTEVNYTDEYSVKSFFTNNVFVIDDTITLKYIPKTKTNKINFLCYYENNVSKSIFTDFSDLTSIKIQTPLQMNYDNKTFKYDKNSKQYISTT